MNHTTSNQTLVLKIRKKEKKKGGGGATTQTLPAIRLRKKKSLFKMKLDRMILKNRLVKPTVGLWLSGLAWSE